MLTSKKDESFNIINYVLLLAIFLSSIKEIINIPLIELNQIFLIFFLLLFINSKKKKEIKNFQITFAQLTIILLISYIVIQGIFLSINYTNFFRMIKNYVLGLLFIMAMLSLDYMDYISIVEKAIRGMTIVFIMEYIIYIFMTPVYNILFYAPYENIRHVASFLSPNSYAIVLAFLITYYINDFILKRKKISILLGIFLFLPLISTYSKSGMLIALGGIVLSMWLSGNKLYKLIVVFFVVVLGGLIVSGAIVNILEQFPDSYFARRFLLYFEEGTLGGERGEDYIEIFNIFRENWLVGVGFGNITGNNEIYQGFSSAHNEYLRFLSEGGIIGGILFFSITFALLKKVIRVFVCRNRKNYIFAIWGILFLMSEMFYNYLNAPREEIILIFMGFGVFTIKNPKRTPVLY